MRGSDQAGANGARAPCVPPLLGQVVYVMATVCERPGMFRDPLIGVCEPSLADGVWVQIRVKATGSQTIWVPLASIAQP